jgi:hypothetical protein
MLIYSCLGSQLRLSHVLRMYSSHSHSVVFPPIVEGSTLLNLHVSCSNIFDCLNIPYLNSWWCIFVIFHQSTFLGYLHFQTHPFGWGVRKVPGAWLLVSMYPQPGMPNKRKSKLYWFDLGHIRQFEGFEPACGCSLAGENKSSRVMHPRWCSSAIASAMWCLKMEVCLQNGHVD